MYTLYYIDIEHGTRRYYIHVYIILTLDTVREGAIYMYIYAILTQDTVREGAIYMYILY